MQNFHATPKEMILSFWRNRHLIRIMIAREIAGRYRGSIMGIFWTFLTPLLMLSIYTFVFSVVFKARWNGGSDSKVEFALILFAGLIVFNLFVECINRAPNLVLGNANYVKKVIFPLEVLPMVSMVSSLFHALIALTVWFLVYFVFYGFPPVTFILVPFILFPLLQWILGITWILASLGVYLRDISQLIGMVSTAIMFLSPLFYPVSAMPEKFQIFLNLNPITPVIEGLRDVIFWGKVPNLNEWMVSFLFSGAIAFFGFVWFQKTRKGFADVI